MFVSFLTSQRTKISFEDTAVTFVSLGGSDGATKTMIYPIVVSYIQKLDIT